jgi:hypothetical protein
MRWRNGSHAWSQQVGCCILTTPKPGVGGRQVSEGWRLIRSEQDGQKGSEGQNSLVSW